MSINNNVIDAYGIWHGRKIHITCNGEMRTLKAFDVETRKCIRGIVAITWGNTVKSYVPEVRLIIERFIFDDKSMYHIKDNEIAPQDLFGGGDEGAAVLKDDIYNSVTNTIGMEVLAQK